jgi:hypothetical protein
VRKITTKIKVIESVSDHKDKQDFYVFNKAHTELLLILRATPEELLSLAEFPTR